MQQANLLRKEANQGVSVHCISRLNLFTPLSHWTHSYLHKLKRSHTGRDALIQNTGMRKAILSFPVNYLCVVLININIYQLDGWFFRIG